MKPTKEIVTLLEKRKKAGFELLEASAKVDSWLEDHGFDIPSVPYDIEPSIGTGCDVFCNPCSAEQSVLKWIESK